MKFIKRLKKDDSGQALVEYVLILSLIACIAMASLQIVGRKASNTLNCAAAAIGNFGGGACDPGGNGGGGDNGGGGHGGGGHGG